MAGYIDKDAVLELARKGVLVSNSNFDSVCKAIRELPAADVVPVKQGKWVEYPECLAFDGAYSDEHIVCSSCHAVWNIMDNDSDRFDYCPSCGARMDGEA